MMYENNFGGFFLDVNIIFVIVKYSFISVEEV